MKSTSCAQTNSNTTQCANSRQQWKQPWGREPRENTRGHTNSVCPRSLHEIKKLQRKKKEAWKQRASRDTAVTQNPATAGKVTYTKAWKQTQVFCPNRTICGLFYFHKVKVCPVTGTFSSRWPYYPFKLYRKYCWINCWRARTRLAKTGAHITSEVTCQHASISAKLALIFLKGHLSFKCILAPRQHKSYCNNPTPYQNWVM